MSTNVLFQELNGSILEEKGIQLIIKREDLFFPKIPGNKWRKLKYNIQFAISKDCLDILSFGGAYSNHLSALASAGKIIGFNTIGIVRGERPVVLNPTLHTAEENGMQLVFVDRQSYKKYTQDQMWEDLQKEYPNVFIIPEGGTNKLALKGCREIIKDINFPYDYICCPAGTGGTVSGILCGLAGTKNVLAFSALKGDFLKGEIDKLTVGFENVAFENWNLISAYHFGGYAKYKDSLLDFMQHFYKKHGIPLDPIYTGKMMYGIFDLIKKDFFPRGSSIVAIHTGGLQGIIGFNQRHDTTLPK